VSVDHAVVPEPGTSAPHWQAAWDNALRAVELDVDDAERLIAAMHTGTEEEPVTLAPQDWIAPALLGPVPVEFAERARALLRRQMDVTERLAEAIRPRGTPAGVRRHRALNPAPQELRRATPSRIRMTWFKNSPAQGDI
jgi:DNA-binding transcriptional LysR family regulator